MIAFSTRWNSHRHSDGAEMVREIIDLGFDHIELARGIRFSLLDGIQKMCGAGQVCICSLHNFWLSPSQGTVASAGPCQFSAVSTAERERAVSQTFQTIDLAARLGASFVILHLGEVKMQPITDQLIQMTKAGEHLSRRYVKAKLKAVQEREKLGPRHLQQMNDCLRRVVDYAAPKKVRLAIESPRRYEEIPTERELPALLDELNSPQLGYWHNFGHAQIKQNLAFLDHVEWLRAIGPRALGCHVEDCIWPAREGEPPFTGSVDFEKLVPLLPTNCLFVWNMNPGRSAAEIRRSVQLWKEHFGG